MATKSIGGLSSDYGTTLTSGVANGVYVKCTGIDPTRLVFFVTRNSSECSSAGELIVLAGSTSGVDDFEPGSYSTLRNKSITVAATTNFVNKLSTSDGSFNIQFFTIPETARFLDSNHRINITCSSELSSVGSAK